LLRERWCRVRGQYALDHFLPAAHHPALVTEYDNMVYACGACNLGKGDRVVPDPLVFLTEERASVSASGEIHTDDPQTTLVVEGLGLNRPDYIQFRRVWLSLIALAKAHDPELYRQLMGYPDDLPDLSVLRPPGGNSRPGGVNLSAFALRAAGTLPETY
jgi:hypothetical protein